MLETPSAGTKQHSEKKNLCSSRNQNPQTKFLRPYTLEFFIPTTTWQGILWGYETHKKKWVEQVVVEFCFWTSTTSFNFRKSFTQHATRYLSKYQRISAIFEINVRFFAKIGNFNTISKSQRGIDDFWKQKSKSFQNWPFLGVNFRIYSGNQAFFVILFWKFEKMTSFFINTF